MYDGDQDSYLELLQSRLDALEYENKRLEAAGKALRTDEIGASIRLEALQRERDEALNRVSQLETQVKTAERSLYERDSKVEALQRAVQQSIADTDTHRNDSEGRIKDLQSKLDDNLILVQNLKEALEAKEGLENENDAVLKAKKAEVALLQARVEKAYVDMENERRELGAQVSELRQAGQVRSFATLRSRGKVLTRHRKQLHYTRNA
jgi:CAP-Gly domain-containing linker protein 1